MGDETFGAAFGRLVKRKRAEATLTQGQLAESVWPNDPDAAVRRKADISKLETGRVGNPHTTTVQRIAAALGIADAEIDALRRQVSMTPQEQLDAVPTLSRNQLELLASRFELERAFDRSDAQLRDFLEKKAEEYRAYRAQIDALDARLPQAHNLKGAAQEAAARLDFKAVEEMLAQMDEVETAIAAETKEVRASNALQRGRVEQAYTLLTAAADSFAGIDSLEPARRKDRYAQQLYWHGLRYGGTGVALAAQTFGAASAAFNEADHPVDWAQTMQNLAVALQAQGARTGGAEGANLLGEAVESYRAALRVLTEADHPVDWAMTMQNLASALRQQGTRTGGSEGAGLLGEAVESYRAALRVRTEADHPMGWAMTQENMALLEEARADHDTCTDPRPHLAAGLAHVEAALTVFDSEHMPFNHGTATALRDRLAARLAALG